MSDATVASPIQPSASDASVIPSCTADRYRGMSFSGLLNELRAPVARAPPARRCAAPRAHQRELGRHEKGVGEHDHHHSESRSTIALAVSATSEVST